MLDQIAEEYEDRLAVAKVNVDDNPEAATRFEIGSIPTFLLFRDGALIGRIVGAPPKPQLTRYIDEHVGGEDVVA